MMAVDERGFWQRYYEREAMETVVAVLRHFGVSQVTLTPHNMMKHLGERVDVMRDHDGNVTVRIKGLLEFVK